MPKALGRRAGGGSAAIRGDEARAGHHFFERLPEPLVKYGRFL